MLFHRSDVAHTSLDDGFDIVQMPTLSSRPLGAFENFRIAASQNKFHQILAEGRFA